MNPDIRSLNYSTDNKWLAMIPFYTIKKELPFKDTLLNLYDCAIPNIELAKIPVSFHGIPHHIPGNVKLYPLEMAFNYIMSWDWHQYKLLNEWYNLIVDKDGVGNTTDYKDFVIPIRVIILSEFKKPVMEFMFENCWISDIGGPSLSYQNGARVLVSNFKVQFSNFYPIYTI